MATTKAAGSASAMPMAAAVMTLPGQRRRSRPSELIAAWAWSLAQRLARALILMPRGPR